MIYNIYYEMLQDLQASMLPERLKWRFDIGKRRYKFRNPLVFFKCFGNIFIDLQILICDLLQSTFTTAK